MLGKVARVAVLFILAVMIASWAFSAVKSQAADPQGDQPLGRMYS